MKVLIIFSFLFTSFSCIGAQPVEIKPKRCYRITPILREVKNFTSGFIADIASALPKATADIGAAVSERVVSICLNHSIGRDVCDKYHYHSCWGRSPQWRESLIKIGFVVTVFGVWKVYSGDKNSSLLWLID